MNVQEGGDVRDRKRTEGEEADGKGMEIIEPSNNEIESRKSNE